MGPNILKIYTDGSVPKNPGRSGGFAVIIEYPDCLNLKNEIIKEGYRATTSNRMELIAVIKALEFIKDNLDKLKSLGINQIKIYTDSEYVSQNQTSVVYWRRGGWRNKDGIAYENPDLWKKFISVKSNVRFPIEIDWIPNKSTPILKEVDQIAKKAAKGPLLKIDFGYRPGKVYRSKVPTGSANLYLKNDRNITVRIYGKYFKNATGKKEYKIIFDLFSGEEQGYTEKCFVYATPKIERELKRSHCYKIELNDNLKYPNIKKVIEELIEK